MEIGYMRVSRGDTQDLAPQLRALTDAGCDPIYREEASGGRTDRRELARAIGALTPGDLLVVWKLDRLSRSPATFCSRWRRSPRPVPVSSR